MDSVCDAFGVLSESFFSLPCEYKQAKPSEGTLLSNHLTSPVLWLCSTPCIYHILEHCNATRMAQKKIMSNSFKLHLLHHLGILMCIYSGSRLQGVEKTWVLDNGPFHSQSYRNTFLGLETSVFSYVCNCLYYTWLSQFNSQVLQKNLPLSDCRWK